MANLKEIRTRIKSVKSTQQLTKAMKMVAAAKLRRAQDRIISLRPYAAKLKEIMGHIQETLDAEVSSELATKREVKNILFLTVTSDKGLCGPFNTALIKELNLYIEENYEQEKAEKRIHFLGIGRKGYEFYQKRDYSMEGGQREVWSNLSFETADDIVEEVFGMFREGTYDKIYLVFNEFKNVMVQNRIIEQFLPVSVDEAPAHAGEESQHNNDYIFEPAKAEIIEELIPKSLKIQFYRALLESNASEQGARMTAMDSATENAEDLLKDLKITYNKARQAAITTEILEIVSGANALESA